MGTLLFSFIVSIVLAIFFTSLLLLILTVFEVFILKQGIFDPNRPTVLLIDDLFIRNKND